MLVVQLLNYAAPMIVLPYMLRALGATYFGKLMVGLSLAQYASVIVDYGFTYTASRRVAQSADDLAKIRDIAVTVYSLKLVLVLVVVAGFSVSFVLLDIPRLDAQIYAVALLNILGAALLPVWLFQGLQRMGLITLMFTVAKLVTLVAVVVSVRVPDDVVLASAFQGAGILVAGLFGSAMAWFIVQPSLANIPTMAALRAYLVEGWPIFLSSMVGNIYGQGALPAVALLAGPEAAGYYGLAMKVGIAAASIAQPVSQALYPRLCHLFAADRPAYFSLRRRVLPVSGVCALLGGIALAALSPWLTRLLSGGRYEELDALLKISAAVASLAFINIFINVFGMAMSRDRLIKKLYLGAATLFFVVSLPATYFWGGVGMAVSMAAAIELFVFFGGIYILSR